MMLVKYQDFIFIKLIIRDYRTILANCLCIDGESFDDMSGSYNIKIDHDVYVLMPSKNVNNLFVNDKKEL